MPFVVNHLNDVKRLIECFPVSLFYKRVEFKKDSLLTKVLILNPSRCGSYRSSSSFRVHRHILENKCLIIFTLTLLLFK